MALTKVTGSVIKDSVSLSGNVSVGGTLTYQDVTNVDALGIGTFRTGIKVLAGQVDVGSNIKLGNAGVITATSFSGVMSGTTGSFSGQINVGSNIKLGTAGVVTATSFVGGLPITSGADNRVITASSASAIQGEANLVFNGTKLGVNQNSPYSELDVTSSVEGGSDTLAAHGIRLAAIGATDEQVIPITAGFKSQQDRVRAGIGFISQISGSSEGYAGAIGFYTRSSADGNGLYRSDEKLRIDDSGRVIIGHTASIGRHEVGDAALQVSGTGAADSGIVAGRWSADNQPAFLELSKSRNATIGNNTAVQADDILGQVQFSGNDGSRYLGAAFIKGIATNPIADYDVAGYLSFGTNYGTTSPTERLRIASDGTVTVGDGNNLAADYVATMLIDGGDNSKLTLYSSTTGSGTIAFSDGSGSGATRMAGFIQMNHTTSDNGPRLLMGQNDLTMLHIRSPGSNRGQLEVYGNFNESDTPAIEINDGGDARKVYLTNSSGDFNALTRNAGQTKGQLKMFESGVFFHAQKDPDSTNVLQTFRAQTYRNQTGSTYTSTTPDQTLIQKGGSGTYDCFYEGNMNLEVNGGGNDHYQPVAFVPLGYDLDTTSFGGQWAGEMWMHQTGSQNPTSHGYSGYNTWATMSFKCRWDCAHWNAKPNGFWVEHYINQGRGNIGKIDASTTMSQFVIYLLPGVYRIRYNCVRGMSVHRAVSDGGSITLRDGGSFATYSTLAFSSRNTSFDNEIAPGSASFAHCT